MPEWAQQPYFIFDANWFRGSCQAVLPRFRGEDLLIRGIEDTAIFCFITA